ncbi:MAG: hypothetical protein V1647_06290, partial [Pseudomonadota bacterium]
MKRFLMIVAFLMIAAPAVSHAQIALTKDNVENWDSNWKQPGNDDGKFDQEMLEAKNYTATVQSSLDNAVVPGAKIDQLGYYLDLAVQVKSIEKQKSDLDEKMANTRIGWSDVQDAQNVTKQKQLEKEVKKWAPLGTSASKEDDSMRNKL